MQINEVKAVCQFLTATQRISKEHFSVASKKVPHPVWSALKMLCTFFGYKMVVQNCKTYNNNNNSKLGRPT